MTDIGQILLTHRRREGYPQATIARLIGVSQSAYSTWESNIKPPSIPALRELARHLHIPSNELKDMELKVKADRNFVDFGN